MTETKKEKRPKNRFITMLAYGFAQLSDTIAYQSFTVYVFTFYYTLVMHNIVYITIGFVIWSLWNSINDPLMGYISDRTNTKWGRRRPYILISMIPLAIMMVLLFTPPIHASDAVKMVYFVGIICAFELFYTMFNLNHTCMFPEVFLDPEERVKAMNIKQIIGIIALLLAFLLPGAIIRDLTDPINFPRYMIAGIVIGVIVIIGIIIFLIWGPRERVEFSQDYKKAPRFWKTLKIAVKNKSFMWFNVVEISNWFVFGILPMIVPLYGEFVLGITDSFLLSLLLGETFIVGALFISVWKVIVKKIGPRKTWMISQLCWLLSLIPLFFIENFVQGAISFAFIGIGLSGSMLCIDLILGDIVDEDEFVSGTRSEGGYWGVTAFFMRLSIILVVISINIVLDSVGWKVFEPATVDAKILIGLRLLMTAFPMTFLAIGIIGMYFYPLHGKRLKEVRDGLEQIHQEKKTLVSR